MNSKNIVIIGGADGPTAIYVAEKFSFVPIICIGVAVAATLIFATYYICKKKKK